MNQHSIRGLPLAAVAGHCVTIVKVRVLEKLLPNQLLLALTARTWSLQNCRSLIPKTKQALREWAMMNLRILSNFFILNNMAERVGFEPVHKPQTKDLTEHGQQT
jgi:hypothetical protein